MIHIKVQEEPLIRIDTNATVTVSDGGYERGYEAGYATGYSEGETAGYAKGEAHGRTEGYAQGKADGYSEGYAEGYAKGYADGYAAGYEAGYEAGKIPIVEKDVNFYNYDGTLLHSYTLEEVRALTELPPAPQMGRDFLTFEEWNWSLEDIKALHLPLSVMATVCPADGNTKAVLEISDARIATVKMNIRQLAGALTVDWGDNTEPLTFDEVTEYTPRTLDHTYDAAGEYIVTLSSFGGRHQVGHGSTTTTFLYDTPHLLTELYCGKGSGSPVNNYGLLQHKRLRVVTFAKGFTTLTVNACYQASCVKSISLPSTVTTLGSNALANLGYLSVLSIPASVTSAPGGAVSGCTALRSLTVPRKCSSSGASYPTIERIYLAEGVTTIASNFVSGGSIRTIAIPSTVTTVGSQAFNGCKVLEKIVFKSLTPPTVSNANAFTGVPSFCIVEVPAESLEAYQNATNYGTIAAQMVGV